MGKRAASAAALWLALAVGEGALGAPVTAARIAELCAQAEGPAHCGRLIEADQLKTLTNLATRNRDRLTVLLFPAGARDFVDVESLHGGTTWSLWDYWSPINIVVLFTTDADRIGYAALQRTTGQVTALPAEPSLSPDRQRLAVADFCRASCDNEVAVWRIARDGIRKERVWKPDAAWTDAAVSWKDAEVLTIEFTPEGSDKSQTLTRRLSDADWRRADSRPAQ